MTLHVGILGGTGPAGRGLGCRLAAAGLTVTLGSRDQERAERVAEELVAAWPGRNLALQGGENAAAAAADIVVIGTPWDGTLETVRPLRRALQGKVVVSMVTALLRVGREIQAVDLPRGSFAATLQAALPGSPVSAAFHHLPAEDLADLDQGLLADILVCADDASAKEATISLVDAIEGLRGLDAGRLSQAGPVEAFTAVCIAVNIRYKVRTYVRLGGI